MVSSKLVFLLLGKVLGFVLDPLLATPIAVQLKK